MLEMKLISLLKNSKVRISLIVLAVVIAIVGIITWPTSEADSQINVAFRADTMNISVGGKDVMMPEVGPGQYDQQAKNEKYDNVYCIDEGTVLSYGVYNKEMDLYNAGESKTYFTNYNSALWVVDNMYITTAGNAGESLDHLANLLTSPDVEANVTSYGKVTPAQIKALNKTVGSGCDIYGNPIKRNLLEIIEQLVIWNYTDNADGNNAKFDGLVDGGIAGSGITGEDQNACKYTYYALKYLANQNSSYTSNGTTSSVVTFDSSNAKINSDSKRVGPYYLKASGVKYNVENIKSKISATVVDASGNSKNVSSDKLVVGDDGAFYIDFSDVGTITKANIAVANIYSGSTTSALVIVNNTNQNLLSIKKSATTRSFDDEQEIDISGKYTIKLIKTKSDGVTPIKDNAAVFSVSGAVTKNNESTNGDGVLEIVTDKNIESASNTDSYQIEEIKAPVGYQKYNGLIHLSIKFKNDGTNIAVDKDNSKYAAEGTNGTVKVEYGDNNLISVYVPNEPDVEIHKGVKEVNNQDSGYDKDEEQDWVIQTKLPEAITKYKEFVITDKIDERLVFSGVNTVSVKVVEGNTLTADTDYKVSFDENNKTLKVSFIEGNFAGKNLKSGDILEIRFNTKFALDKDGNIIALNQSVPNEATLEFDNGSGERKKVKTERPEVHTGGVGLYKYDDRNKNGKHDSDEPALEGAHFKIAKSQEDAKAGKFVKNAAGKELEAISNEHGVAVFEGLEFGEDAINKEKYKTGSDIFGNPVYAYDWTKVQTTYYIVETVSPEGYGKIKEPIEAIVKKDNYNISDIGSLIQVANISNIHDLSLRKFITAVDNTEVKDRIPVVDLTDLISGKSTTAKYTHTKEPVLVATSQIVTYTIRVYNEGPQDTYASIVKDNIPEGLEFVTYKEGDGSINDQYKWKLQDAEGKEVTDPTKAKFAVTEYLGKDKAGKNLIKGFYPNIDKELDYRDVKILFRVTEPNTSDRILINEAQISEERNSEGEVVKDRDSVPNVWNEGEDDQDIEKVRVLYFDLALRKWVTTVMLTENGQTQVIETGHKAEDDPEQIVKVDLKKSKLSDVTVKYKYSIRVTNQGEIPGEATEIRDDIPNGLEFVAEDNPDWKVVDGKVVTDKLANKTLQPGESAEVEIILTWINSENNMGTMINVAEISKDHNKYGSKDIDSTPGNMVPGEDDIDDAPVMLSVKTGSETISYVVIAFAALSIVGIGTILIKKYVR